MRESPGPPARFQSGRAGGPEPEAPVALGGQVPLPPLRRFSHEAMATVFEIVTPHGDQAYAAQAAREVFELVDQLERELSRFIPNSDIARINRLGAGESTRVSPATFECLTIARHVFDLTGGAFDIAIGTGLPGLELREGSEVRASSAGIQLDLGAVGKGYAVDRMAELLEEWSIGPALVHGGFSSILALEPPAGLDGWPLTFSDPLEPSRVLLRLSVRQTALSASGVRKRDHIRDPRTGAPVRTRLAAWAALERPEETFAGVPGESPRIAPAAVADALTTAFMLMDPEEIGSLCDSSPGLDAWLLPAAGDRPEDREVLHFGRSF